MSDETFNSSPLNATCYWIKTWCNIIEILRFACSRGWMGGTEDLRGLLSSWERARSPLSRRAIRRGLGDLRLGREDIADRIAFSGESYRRTLIYRGASFEAFLV